MYLTSVCRKSIAFIYMFKISFISRELISCVLGLSYRNTCPIDLISMYHV